MHGTHRPRCCPRFPALPAERNENPGFDGKWAGYNPEAQGASLYPNEVSSDFAFIPFGEWVLQAVVRGAAACACLPAFLPVIACHQQLTSSLIHQPTQLTNLSPHGPHTTTQPLPALLPALPSRPARPSRPSRPARPTQTLPCPAQTHPAPPCRRRRAQVHRRHLCHHRGLRGPGGAAAPLPLPPARSEGGEWCSTDRQRTPSTGSAPTAPLCNACIHTAVRSRMGLHNECCVLTASAVLLCLPLLQVGMATGATIHTANGLKCTVERRVPPPAAAAAAAAPAAAVAAAAGSGGCPAGAH